VARSVGLDRFKERVVIFEIMFVVWVDDFLRLNLLHIEGCL
jgi:hypothetical protein